MAFLLYAWLIKNILEGRDVLYLPILLCKDTEKSEDSTRSKSDSEPESEEVKAFSPGGGGASNEKSKSKELQELRETRSEIIDTLRENKQILKNIDKAVELDEKLPEEAKNKNSHMNDIKEEFSSFFDKDYTNKESLDEVKYFLNSENKTLGSMIDNLTAKMDNLSVENPNNNPKKRGMSESESESESNADSLSSSKKRSRKNDEDNNGPTGGGGFGCFGPSNDDSNSSNTSSGDSAEPSSSKSHKTIWLDIVINILKALFGDDDYMD